MSMETRIEAVTEDDDTLQDDAPPRDERACPLWGFQEIMDGMRAAGMSDAAAERLVLECGRERCLQQVRWLAQRPDPGTGTRAEMLQQAIKEDWPAPDTPSEMA